MKIGKSLYNEYTEIKCILSYRCSDQKRLHITVCYTLNVKLKLQLIFFKYIFHSAFLDKS